MKKSRQTELDSVVIIIVLCLSRSLSLYIFARVAIPPCDEQLSFRSADEYSFYRVNRNPFASRKFCLHMAECQSIRHLFLL